MLPALLKSRRATHIIYYGFWGSLSSNIVGIAPPSVVEYGITDWFQIGKRVRHPALFNFYAEYIMRNTWLEEA